MPGLSHNLNNNCSLQASRGPPDPHQSLHTAALRRLRQPVRAGQPQHHAADAVRQPPAGHVRRPVRHHGLPRHPRHRDTTHCGARSDPVTRSGRQPSQRCCSR